MLNVDNIIFDMKLNEYYRSCLGTQLLGQSDSSTDKPTDIARFNSGAVIIQNPEIKLMTIMGAGKYIVLNVEEYAEPIIFKNEHEFNDIKHVDDFLMYIASNEVKTVIENIYKYAQMYRIVYKGF